MPPVAEASVSQTIGNLTTIFQFDASASSDNENDISVLQVRWDWGNDGAWFWTSTEADNSAWIRWIWNVLPDQIGRMNQDSSGNTIKNYGLLISAY